LSKKSPSIGIINGDLADFNTFMTSTANALGVKNISSVTKCMNKVTVVAYWKYLDTTQALLKALVAADQLKVKALYVAMIGLEKVLNGTFQCIVTSPAQQKINNALGYPKDFPVFAADEIYGQGQTQNWLDNFTPVYTMLTNGYFKSAGPVMAKVMKARAHNQTTEMNQTITQAFHNGIFYFFNVSLPFDFFPCWNNANASIYTAVVGGWIRAVGESSATTAFNVSNEYLVAHQAGLKKIAPCFECEDSKKSAKAFFAKTGINPHDEAFLEKMGAWMKNNQATFYTLFHEMSTLIAPPMPNPLGAGAVYGYFLQQVANS